MIQLLLLQNHMAKTHPYTILLARRLKMVQKKKPKQTQTNKQTGSYIVMFAPLSSMYFSGGVLFTTDCAAGQSSVKLVPSSHSDNRGNKVKRLRPSYDNV